MKCKNCGNELESGMIFCGRCGTPVIEENILEETRSEKSEATISIKKDTLGKVFTAILAAAALLIAAVVIVNVLNDGREKDSKEASAPLDTEEEGASAAYDADVWDYRLPEPPGYVAQKYYAVFYEKSRDNRIELAVFDIEGDLGENHIVWNGTGEPLILSNQNVMKNCDQFYYEGNKWVEFNSGYYRIGDSAKNIISSNLDIKDSDGNMVQPHITAEGISESLDLSQYQEQKQAKEETEKERTVEKIYVYPEASDKVEKVYVYPDNGSDGYIIPGSDYRYLSRSELYGLSALQLRLARNEIYARYGRMFKDEGLQKYFDSCSWYWPSISPGDFKESVLNKYEKANIELIAQYEKDMGY